MEGEHIIPEAIGGVVTLNEVSKIAVCQRCNSGILSQLDRELCSRSYLSVIASRELGANLWQAWDVDHGSDNLLLEARPAWAADKSFKALVCHPQIVIERSGPGAFGDSQESAQFGREDAVKVLFQAARRCFQRHCEGKKGSIHFERVRSGVIQDGYRLPPRIFAPHPIDDIAENSWKQSFVLRFASRKDMGFALHSLSNLRGPLPMKKWAVNRGSHYPAIGIFFDIGLAIRALMKIGLNLIAAYCPNTPVNRESFAAAVSVVRGKLQLTLRGLERNGFVRPTDVQEIAAADNGHSFRLMHIDGIWHVLSSFFAGNVGAFVKIPGPNHERWRWADIDAPLGSKSWV